MIVNKYLGYCTVLEDPLLSDSLDVAVPFPDPQGQTFVLGGRVQQLVGY